MSGDALIFIICVIALSVGILLLRLEIHRQLNRIVDLEDEVGWLKAEHARLYKIFASIGKRDA